MTSIVSMLSSMGWTACEWSVTIGEAISMGEAPFAGGTKEKAPVVHWVGAIMATSLDVNCKDHTEEALVETWVPS